MISAHLHSEIEMSKAEISHIGKVVAVDPEFTTVEILSESACTACHAKGLCGISEYKTKAVKVPSSSWQTYCAGDEVDVLLKASMGHKAVWLAYVLPLIVLLAFMFLPLSLGCGELVSALCAFAAVAVYYLCIYALRDKLNNQYIFTIQPRKGND